MWLKILTSGWTWAGVLLLLLVLSRLELAGAELIHATERLADEKAHAQQLIDVVEQERAEVKKYTEIAAQLEQEKETLANEKDAVIAGLRADTLRLRRRFTCPATSVSAESSASGERDGGEAGGLSKQDAEFLVRFAAEADERVIQLQACQNVLKETVSD